MEKIALVRGAGDVGSAIAHALTRQDWRVVLHDVPAPAHPRRGMSFVDAFFLGSAALEEIEARRVDDAGRLRQRALDSASITVTAVPFEQVLGGIRPWILIDARMRKHGRREASRGLAPVTIGIGPGFAAGHTVDLVVESAWGEHLGQIIRTGEAISVLGEPSVIGGVGRERFVYASDSGRFETRYQIGQAVTRGEVVANIGSRMIAAPLSGQIRGLAHDEADIEAGSKVLEVIPSGTAACFGIGTRPAKIAEGVIFALSSGEPSVGALDRVMLDTRDPATPCGPSSATRMG